MLFSQALLDRILNNYFKLWWATGSNNIDITSYKYKVFPFTCFLPLDIQYTVYTHVHNRSIGQVIDFERNVFDNLKSYFLLICLRVLTTSAFSYVNVAHATQLFATHSSHRTQSFLYMQCTPCIYEQTKGAYSTVIFSRVPANKRRKYNFVRKLLILNTQCVSYAFVFCSHITTMNTGVEFWKKRQW